MKNFRIFLLRSYLIMVCFVATSAAFAQDTKKIDVTIGTKSSDGFVGSPWMWVVGGAVFILLLVALLRSGKQRSA